MNDASNLLTVQGLCRYFHTGRGRNRLTIKAVDDVSFGIRPGETFGLVGESGCGKTTLGRTILRLYQPTAGQVLFHGKDISGPMTADLRHCLTRNMAMIFQDPIESLNPRMTAGDIIGEGLRVREIGDGREIRRRVAEMLQKVGLAQEHANRYPHEFSGGQRQRIGIARALITKPSIIIADEPVSALDVSIQAQIINLLQDLKEEMGLTILFIAHNLSVVKYFSHRIGVMYRGKLVEIARGEDLYQKPLHPYTKALLSAIPRPNPRTEAARMPFEYDPPAEQEDTVEKPTMAEVEPEHFVYCSPGQLAGYQKRK